jgi:hypothetical protein
MAYDSALAAKLAKEVRRNLDSMRRKNESWCGMTRWFLWSAAARHGIVEIVDPAKAQWGDRRGVEIKKGHKRTLDVAWRRIFAG